MHAVHEVNGLLDKLVHVCVIFHERDKLAVGGHEILDKLGGFQRATELESLSCIEKLDTENLLHIVDHQIALGGGVGTHAHMVFLTL